MPSVVAPRLLLTTAVAAPPPVETVGVADRLDACVLIVGVVPPVDGDADPPTESAVVVGVPMVDAVGVPIAGELDVPIVATVDVPIVEERELPSVDDVPEDGPVVGDDPPVVGAEPVLLMPRLAANASKSDAIPAIPSLAANAAKSTSDAGGELTAGGVDSLALGTVGDGLALGPVGVVGPLKPNGVVEACA